ncbi:DEAD/DEAH box helicase [Acidocella sp. KAb 2-4]|uniref:DEAD/DEAH box helicase n=1 Tax=Acidocella sp. KAb 2-4 TaxID=2885158 RepID=UPI001D07A46A|nr:DEAD/DEAH box helicase [Acidocella sp. KAb 2-4]MCB5944993.1 SNF2 family helicase [Acidocella sp. KAb 2-4]
MPVTFSAEDFDRVFDSSVIRRAQSLIALGFVKDVSLQGDTIDALVEDMDGTKRTCSMTPEKKGSRISFAERECSCGERGCRHLAATALAALAKFPQLRKQAPKQLIDTIIPARERPPAPAAAPRIRATGRRPKAANLLLPAMPEAPEPGATILDRQATPVLRLRRVHGPDEFNRQRMIDVLTLDFDYGGVRVDGADENPFIRIKSAGQIAFIRREIAAEAEALDQLRPDGFVQMRVADGKSARGQRVLVFRGQESAAKWHHFVAVRVPELTALGWLSHIDANFGPQLAENVGNLDVKVEDGEAGTFSLEFGVEVDGERIPLLPILENLLNKGGIDAAQIVEGEIITSLEDGRVVKLPADRIRRLLAVMGDLIESAGRTTEKSLVLPVGAAATVLELEDVLTTSWQNAADIEAYVERFRGEPDIIPVEIPPEFKAALRPYQQHGVDWLQHLASYGLGGFLADDMGLGKTAQTIANICVEYAAGRLTAPALIVVPTSLVANWTAELAKFAPHLKVVVLHGLERHEKRERLDDVNVVVTTYTVLTRDIEEMKPLPWHLVVLDEAQAIKSPEARATRAVCQLKTTNKICLSGTPIENNLDELWSQFAFLMPGLLGDRRGFTKRFRTPIEKNGDPVVRAQLVNRIQPFILRRTKQEVATELPPKHTILRRITLAPDQRELYETIRGTLYETVKEQMAERTLAQSRVIVLDALLKLRQACCDPRLVRIGNSTGVESSAKLDDLMEMLNELIPEGRRILVFSQFTSMLDLIKPRLDEAGIRFVELRGDTRDRATPVQRFEAGEVPVFLISLKAGGRGLNLTSADTVIHYDPWWNPAVEAQASDRAHRIGQTKSVFVYKLIATETVEERILELQQRKAELASIAFQEGGGMAFNAEDIDFLFGADAPAEAAAA